MIAPFGDDALIARTNEPQDVIEARAALLRASGTFEEVVPTLGTLTVVFAGGDGDAARHAFAAGLEASVHPAGGDAPPLTIPVRYDGADLPGVAERLGLSIQAVAEAHASGDYAVQFLGFTPGFAYLGGVPDVLLGVPRLASPRTRVPSGSIGMVGDRTGLYALPGPGGWPIIGRTEASLFCGERAAPLAVAPGQRVRFEPA